MEEEQSSPINLEIDQHGVPKHEGDIENEHVRMFGLDETDFDPGDASMEEEQAIIEDESAEAKDMSLYQNLSPGSMRGGVLAKIDQSKILKESGPDQT